MAHGNAARDRASAPSSAAASRARARRLHTILADPLYHYGLHYTMNELLDAMGGRQLEVRLWTPHNSSAAPRDYHRVAFPSLVYRALRKSSALAKRASRHAVARALDAVAPGDFVYVWPPYGSARIEEAKARGAIVVAERVNCHAERCKTALVPAFARHGLGLPDGWCVQSDMDEETRQMKLCDFVFAPNAFVTESLVDVGVPRERVLPCSYGWSPTRLAHALDVVRPARDPVFLFVGSGIVRKGLDLLLEAWERASVRGELRIAGNVEPLIRERYARALARPDVVQLGFVSDVASVYAAADVFVFPSHEEGGPQVTYEAAATGLPGIVSPMGAGLMVRHEREGLVLDPFDVDAWAAAITRLADDRALREELGRAARERAEGFTWERVGARRRDQLVEAAAPRP